MGVAVDSRSRALAQARALATKYGVSKRVRLVHAVLDEAFPENVRTQRFGLVHVSRWLHRPLFGAIREVVLEGGLIAITTFMRGACHPVNPAHTLESGELASQFGRSAGFQVLRDDIHKLAEDGRPVCLFLARRSSR